MSPQLYAPRSLPYSFTHMLTKKQLFTKIEEAANSTIDNQKDDYDRTEYDIFWEMMGLMQNSEAKKENYDEADIMELILKAINNCAAAYREMLDEAEISIREKLGIDVDSMKL